jgi:hypothetical protein
MGLALAIVAALAASAFAQGNNLQYRVKQDDTLDVIAAEFYGDRALAKLIVTENKLKQKRVQAGQRLRVPVTREVVTEKGDTFESLAQTHLGDARRAVVLADFNEHDVSDIPAVGTPISIPIQITHVAQGPESLASIATLYWNDPKQGEVLRRYNFLDKPSLEKGEPVIVPMIKVRVRKSQGADSDGKERRDVHNKAVDEAMRALPVARTAWLAGDFAAVKAALGPLAPRIDYLETAQAIEVGMLFGKALLAFDDMPHAVESFKVVLGRKPTLALSAYAESPKVIDAWKKAGGQLAQ